MADNSGIKVYDGVSKVDPLVMSKYVGKVVEVSTSYGQIIKGTVVTIDPITESYILAINDDKRTTMTIIMGRSVKSVAFVDEKPNLFSFKSTLQNFENLEQSRNRLKDWLEKNRIPVVQENDVLKIDDTLFIHPPYRAENVFSSNEMVLHRILGVIEKMPVD